MMATVLLIRHGETEWNRERVYRGRKDIPLSDNGRSQANRLAAALAESPIKTIYASPLSRAVETAVAVARVKGLEVNIREEFIDMDFGDWEGLSVDEARERDPELYDTWENAPQDFVPPHGESLTAIRTRADAGLAQIIQTHPDQLIAIVTHRVVCKLLICSILGLPSAAFWKIQQDVCCFNAFSIDEDKSVLLRMNDTCHLHAPLGEVRLDF
jgi:phosphoserine phosphatase